MDSICTRKKNLDEERQPLYMVIGYRSESCFIYRCAVGLAGFALFTVIATGVLIWALTRQANGGGGSDHTTTSFPTSPTDSFLTSPFPTDPWPDDPTLLRLSMAVRSTMNTAADPCENFMLYSCGGWLKNNPLPFSANHINRFMNTILSNVESLKKLVEGDDSDEIEAVRLAREFYSSCMDTDAIDDRGVQPLRDLVQLTGGYGLPLTFRTVSNSIHEW